MRRPRRPTVDVRIENHGSLYLLRPLTAAARSWFNDFLPVDAPRFGAAYVVEPRYVGDILLGVRGDGMVAQ